MDICPCKDCTKRWVSSTSRCHASCKEYKEWSEFCKEQNSLIARQQMRTDSIGRVLYSHRRKNN